MPNQRRKEAARRARRGTAEPRWGWSGVASLTAPQSSASDIDLPSLLPGHRSSDGQLSGCSVIWARSITATCIRTSSARRERSGWPRCGCCWMGLELLMYRLHGLPEDLQLQLSDRLARSAVSAEREIDNFQAYRGDTAAVRQICEAAVDVEQIVRTATTRDAEWMADLSDAAQKAAEPLSALDTTTAGTTRSISTVPRSKSVRM
jgi:hypothetical protein